MSNKDEIELKMSQKDFNSFVINRIIEIKAKQDVILEVLANMIAKNNNTAEAKKLLKDLEEEFSKRVHEELFPRVQKVSEKVDWLPRSIIEKSYKSTLIDKDKLISLQPMPL